MSLSWVALSERAGSPRERPFEAKFRLFGADQPEVVFWRDNSAWCPYCSKIWLALELMEIPYQVKTVPLRGYMAQGESKDPAFLAMIPSGVVPALQFRSKAGAGEFADAKPLSNKQLFQTLQVLYPDRFPLGDAHLYHTVCSEGGVVDRFEVARTAFEACAGAPCGGGVFGRGLREACVALDKVLESSGGPFVNGDKLTIPDCQLIPLLERVEATVPYFFGKSVLEDEVPFARVHCMLEAARQHSFFGEIASDATTLGRTNVCYAPRGFMPDKYMSAEMDGLTPSAAEQWFQAARNDLSSRQDAAARVISNHAAIIGFALRSANGFRRNARVETLNDRADERFDCDMGALDFCLRVVTELLLADVSLHELLDNRNSLSLTCKSTYGEEVAAFAAETLDALALFVGVPRDMGERSARAFRSHLRYFSSSLRCP